MGDQGDPIAPVDGLIGQEVATARRLDTQGGQQRWQREANEHTLGRGTHRKGWRRHPPRRRRCPAPATARPGPGTEDTKEDRCSDSASPTPCTPGGAPPNRGRAAVASSTPSTTLKIAVLAPIPSARARTAATVTPGVRRNDRRAQRRSRPNVPKSADPTMVGPLEASAVPAVTAQTTPHPQPFVTASGIAGPRSGHHRLTSWNWTQSARCGLGRSSHRW